MVLIIVLSWFILFIHYFFHKSLGKNGKNYSVSKTNCDTIVFSYTQTNIQNGKHFNTYTHGAISDEYNREIEKYNKIVAILRVSKKKIQTFPKQK